MKHALLIICLLICFSAGFEIDPEHISYSRAWSVSDPLLPVLLIVIVFQFLMSRWSLDVPAMWQIASILFFALSALVNDALSNGTLLNFSRTAVGDLLLYVTAYNVVRTARDIRQFGIYCLALAGLVMAVSIPSLILHWSGGFVNAFFVFGGTDLNTFGFLFVLLFCASSSMWLRDEHVGRGTVCAAVLAAGALTSLSRSAVSNFLIAMLVAGAVTATKGKRSRRGIRTAAMALGGIAGFYVWFRFAANFAGALSFGQGKLNDFGDDAVNTRIVQLTLVPIREWTQQPLMQVIFGDAVSFQHTFLANALWMTGILGLIGGLGLYISMAMTAMRPWRKGFLHLQEHRITGAMFGALLLVMFLDDSTTNHRFHASIVSYLFYTSAGAFAGTMRRQVFFSPQIIAAQQQIRARYPVRV